MINLNYLKQHNENNQTTNLGNNYSNDSNNKTNQIKQGKEVSHCSLKTEIKNNSFKSLSYSIDDKINESSFQFVNYNFKNLNPDLKAPYVGDFFLKNQVKNIKSVDAPTLENLPNNILEN